MRFTGLMSICVAFAVSGCGTYVPDLQEFYQSKTDARLRVETLVEHLQCEVVSAVQSVLLKDEDLASQRKAYGLPEVTVLDWLKKWAAQITLTLTVEEKSALNPGLTVNRYFPTVPVFPEYKLPVNAARIFNLGLAGLTQPARRLYHLSRFIKIY